MGARSILTAAKPKQKRVYKRMGSATDTDKALVAAVVMDSPRELSTQQTNALATVLRRSKDVVKTLIEEARENFQANAKRYVELHMQAVEDAVASGDPKALGEAMKGAAWAISNLSAEGTRIVEKETKGPTGTQILINIPMGATDQSKAIKVVDVTPQIGAPKPV